jgi:anti-anti-sigma regulatory factor
MTALPVLADAVSQLAAASPRSVFVDLAGVTFAGSALPNFLAPAR